MNTLSRNTKHLITCEPRLLGAPKTAGLASIILLFILYFPNLPTYFQSPQTHVFIISVTIICLFFMIIGRIIHPFRLKQEMIFFILLQILLIAALLKEMKMLSLSYGHFISFLRPSGIFCIYLFFYTVYIKGAKRDFTRFYHTISQLVMVMTISCFVYALLEICTPYVDNLALFLYKRDIARIENLATFFLHTSYFAGFVAFIFHCYYSGRFITFGGSVNLLFLIVTTFLIFSSGSKSIIVAWAVSIALLLIFRLRNNAVSIITSVLIGFVLIYFFYNFWWKISTAHPALSEIDRMIFELNEVGTIKSRQLQIEFAIETSKANFGFSGGLGRDVTLESWLAQIVYRYGFYGLAVYIIFFSHLGYNLLKKSLYSNDVFCRDLATGGLIWVICLPFSLGSSNMLESGKTSIIGFWYISILFVMIRSRVCYRHSSRISVKTR